MIRIAALVASLAVSLAATGAILSATDDQSILVPSPEAVAVSFLRQIAAGRYGQALPYLVKEQRRKTRVEHIEQLASQIEQHFGCIEKVREGSARVQRGKAEASVVIQTDRGEVPLSLVLIRENRLWKIAALPEIH